MLWSYGRSRGILYEKKKPKHECENAFFCLWDKMHCSQKSPSATRNETSDVTQRKPNNNKNPTAKQRKKEKNTYFIFSSRLESGFSEVVCLTILYMVMTRKMRFNCGNKSRERMPLLFGYIKKKQYNWSRMLISRQ